MIDDPSEADTLLQCLDVVLGAMAFVLNRSHRAIPKGGGRRGKRTVAKHNVSKAILAEIGTIRPNFNPGISTGRPGGTSDTWELPYLHWNFRTAGAARTPDL
jgi:hypothetical protein